MPELPEVEVIRSGLADSLIGHTIDTVSVFGRHGDRILRRHIPGPSDFCGALANRTVTAVKRRGKYLWWVLDDDDALLAHLGMSGQFRISQAAAGDVIPHCHTRVRVTFAQDALVVDYVDQRTFGAMQFVRDGAELPDPIAHIARDPMDPQFDQAAVIAKIRGKRTTIKRALLDQSVVSGIGNIYADEALWRAKIHYNSPASVLSTAQVEALLRSAADVMAEALAVGGTSFDAMYVNVAGESGYFERSLNVYGRGGEPCDRCGAPLVREKFTNRSSFLCLRCQPPIPARLLTAE